MRVLISAVGKRTEHWEGFFDALVAQPQLELDVLVADVSELTLRWLDRLATAHPERFRVRVAAHLIGEERTGHMASVAFAPGALREWQVARPDVIHLIGEPAYVSTAQMIRLRDQRWPDVPVSHYAAQNVRIRLPLPFPWLERRAYRRIDLALPITPAARTVLRSKGFAGPAQVVPLGVDLGRFTPASAPPGGPFTVGFVGRLEPHKGIEDLLAAAGAAGVRLLMVGDGSLRGLVEARAADRPGDVELVRWSAHDELPSLMRRMHVLALPSVEVVQRNVLPWVRVPLREQFGRVLVEAMACGVPCVGTRVGEIAEVVGDGGLLVEQRRPDQLERAFRRIRDDSRLAASLRDNALRRAQRFDWNHIACQVSLAWQQLQHTQTFVNPSPAPSLLTAC